MSAEGEKPKPSVCENFEPQAWRKTICKNCFQPPDKHVPGETTGAPGPAGKENKPPTVPEKPKPGIKTGVDEKNVAQKSDKDKTGTSLAHSIKDKYEQLEKDKYGQKEPPKVPPKTTNKSKPGLSSIADKYEKLKDDSKMSESTKVKGETKTNENIPSSTQSKKDNLFGPKFLGKKDDSFETNKSLNKTKFGSVENLSKADEKQKVDFRLSSKSKFGSMENVSGAEKSKEPIQIPIQRSKFGGSVETLSTEKSKQKVSQSDLAKRNLINKLDDFSNELKAGATSKSGSTVIHKQSDGNIDVIPIPKKSNTSKSIDNEALQNEMNELKMSRVGDKSGQIKPQIDQQSKTETKLKSQIDTNHQNSLKHDSSPTKSVSPERKPGFKLDIGKSDESGENRPLVRRNSGFKLDMGTPTESPEIKPGFKIDFKKSESPTKDPKRRNSGFKLEFEKSESPTKDPLRKSPEKKSGFKLNFDKSESPTKEPQGGEKKSGFKLNLSPSPTKDVVNIDDKSKLDLRSGLKKAENKQTETPKLDISKSEGKQKFELPFLKSSKERKDEHKTENFSDNKVKESDKKSKSEESLDTKTSFSLKSLKSPSEEKTIKVDVKKDIVSDKNETSKTHGDKITETEKTKFVNSFDNEKLNTNAKDADVRKSVNEVRKVKDKPNKSHTEESIDITKESEQKYSNESQLKAPTEDHNKSSNNVPEKNIQRNDLSKTENEMGAVISFDKIDQNKIDAESKILPVSENDNKFSNGKSEKEMEIVKNEKAESISALDKNNLSENTKEIENTKNDKILTHIEDNKENDKDKASHDSISTKSDNGIKDENNTKFESIEIKAEKQDKGTKEDLIKIKDSKEGTERKENCVERNFKSNDRSKNEDDRTGFKKEDSTKLQENKSKKISDSEDKLQQKDLNTKTEPKRKVESPFLKSSRHTEEDKKTPLENKKKSLETKSNKTFEVPKLKSAKTDDKEKDNRFSKPESKFKTEEPKRKFEVPSLKSSKDEKDKKEEKKWGFKQEEQKKKYELPNLKSKEDKGKVSEKTDLKSDEKKKVFEVPKLKSSKATETEKKDEKLDVLSKKDEPKNKFNLPNLKSSKQDDKTKPVEKLGLKSQPEENKNKVLDRLNLKSAKTDKPSDSLKPDKDPKKKPFEIEKQSSNTFERPKLKSAKDHKVLNEKVKEDEKSKAGDRHVNLDKNKQEEKLKLDTKSKLDDKYTTDASKGKIQKDLEKPLKGTTTKNSKETFQEKHKEEGERETSMPTPVEKMKTVDASSTSTIGIENFETISADIEGRLNDEDYACANDSASEDNYLHVDTQVFTSSRNKTAEVTDDDISDLNISGTKDLDFIISKRGSRDGDSLTLSHGASLIKEGEQLKSLQDGKRSPSPVSVYISSEIENDSSVQRGVHGENKDSINNDTEITRLRQELLLMTERCSNLEKENTLLRDGLDKKDSDQIKLKQQKDDVDNVIKGLQAKIQSMEDICEQLEYDNKNLKNSVKAHVDDTKSNKDLKKGNKYAIESNGTIENEKDIEEIMEENEQLKQEIAELKLEMDEMYDSFRDQEAEEFRELQKELEITAKNCRILQFKLRKLERHNDQVEHDRNQFEDRLRRLQDQFQDRDAVSHIHSLEDELRMAKDVSVRLHDELDLLEEKRGKIEEENRHLTELLEQADRKQFRLELEVDKLRDKVLQLRTELTAAKDPNSSEPRKLNCAEFLALHREVI